MKTKQKVNWKSISLGEIIDIYDNIRVPLSSLQRAEIQGNFPYYGASGVIDHVNDYLFDGEYILIAEDGENLNSRKLPIAFMARGRFWVNNHAHIVKAKKGIADDRFLIGWFAQADIKGYITGAAQPKLSQSNLKRIVLSIPPLPTQRKIASVLSAYDDLIENNTRRIAILEEMAQRLYKEWFVNFRFPGHENAKFVDSPLGKIPEGWEPNCLGDLAKEVRRGVDPSQIDAETPYLGLEHLPRRSVTLGDWGRAAEVQSTKLAFKKGEIIFGKIRPYFHKVGVAPIDGVCSSDAIVVVPKSSDVFGTVLCCVSSDDFIRHATQTSQGTKMPRANWDVLVKYPLPTPPDRLLSDFNVIFTEIVSSLQLLMFKNRNLRTTRDLLLPKLISGQLDVEDLDIDTLATLVDDQT
jgi:type I restriction enzyme S subunit